MLTNAQKIWTSPFTCDRIILIVLDSLGVGAAPDAERFGDHTANTLLHISQWCQKNKKDFQLPNLSEWGLHRILDTQNLAFGFSHSKTKASLAKLIEISPGKDTTTGHWEMAGTALDYEFPVFEKGFDSDFLKTWVNENNLPGFLGNYAASGTEILVKLGEEHIRTGKPIVYTSADSVFQVAAHENHFGLERLYEICRSARKHLDSLGVGRVIARPFVGETPNSFKRTENRRDYSVPPPSPNLLDILRQNNRFVAGIGKIEDIFAHRSVNIVDHTGRNETSLEATLKCMQNTQNQSGLIFTNLIDFDQLHGHRRNPKTYAEALMQFDLFLPRIEALSTPKDLVVLTADHGNDPTHTGTDHTRENVPLLFWSKHSNFEAKNLGTLRGFAAVSKLCLEALGLNDQISKLPSVQEVAAL